MDPRVTKALAIVIPFLIGLPNQPDIAKVIAPHPIASYLVFGAVWMLATYLGIGLSGPTAAPKLAAMLGNPASAAPPEPPKAG